MNFSLNIRKLKQQSDQVNSIFIAKNVGQVLIKSYFQQENYNKYFGMRET